MAHDLTYLCATHANLIHDVKDTHCQTHTQNGGAHGCVFATFKRKPLQTMLLIHSFLKTPVASLFFKLFLSKGPVLLLCSLSPLTLSCPCRAAVLAAIKSQKFMERVRLHLALHCNHKDDFALRWAGMIMLSPLYCQTALLWKRQVP